jgi:hypothetical protein
MTGELTGEGTEDGGVRSIGCEVGVFIILKEGLVLGDSVGVGEDSFVGLHVGERDGLIIGQNIFVCYIDMYIIYIYIYYIYTHPCMYVNIRSCLYVHIYVHMEWLITHTYTYLMG